MTAATSTTAPRSAADIVGLVGELITANNLRPGERLPPIRELAARFGVKTGAVRDALLDAQGKGIVKVLPRVGAIVQSPADGRPSQPIEKHMIKGLRELMAEQDQNLFHVLDTREVLELSTIAEASRRRELPDLFRLRQILEEMAAIPVTEQAPEPEYVDLDIQFHLEIGRLSGNTVTTSMLRVLLEELIPHLARIRWSAQRREETNTSHARMYRALVAGDVEAAQDEMRAHIRTAYGSLLEELREPPSMNY